MNNCCHMGTNTSHDCGFVNLSHSVTLVVNSAYIFQVGLGLLSLFFNSIIVISVVGFRFLDNKCNHIIANFSAANFLLSLGILSKAVRGLIDTGGNRIPPVLRKATLSFHNGTLTAVLLWALSLASDRYVAIFEAQFYNRPSVNQFRIFAFILWSMSGISAYVSSFFVIPLEVGCVSITYSPWSSFSPEFTSAFAIFYVTLGTLTLLFYVIIVVCTKRKIENIRRQGGEQQLRAQMERTRSLLSMILLILVSFSICHLVRPIVYHLETGVMHTPSYMRDVIYEYMSLIMLMDGIFTCAVYFARSNEYRQALVFILCCDWSKREFASLSAYNNPVITTTSPSRKSSNRVDNDIHLKIIESNSDNGGRSAEKLLPSTVSDIRASDNEGT